MHDMKLIYQFCWPFPGFKLKHISHIFFSRASHFGAATVGNSAMETGWAAALAQLGCAVWFGRNGVTRDILSRRRR